MKELKYKYVLPLTISAVDDSNKGYDKLLYIKSSYPISHGAHEGHQMDLPMLRVNRPRASYGITKGEPMITALSQTLSQRFGWGRSGSGINAPSDFDVIIEIRDVIDAHVMILVSKVAPHYQLMGLRVTKKNLLTALSRTIYRSCFDEDGHSISNYLMKMITLPENVSYALENRAPYEFYIRKINRPSEVVNSRLRIEMISDTECAMELSDGVWGTITVKELDSFMNHYYHGHTRSKRWTMISPKKLWSELIGTPPTEGQLKVMVNFLQQNRSQDIVERRAKKLMENLEVTYPDRIKIIEADKRTRLYVKGKLADWLIVDTAWKSNIQKVSTYIFRVDDLYSDGVRSRNRGKLENVQHGSWIGPICIDNIHSNSSVGDQFVARAMALLNDKTTIELVYTIKGYLSKGMINGESPERINWDYLVSPEEIYTELHHMTTMRCR